MAAPRDVVRDFLTVVRSGAQPERAGEFMAPEVAAHQLQGEDPVTVTRTPQEYAEHVREMRSANGDFSLVIDELLADGDRVYARWTQKGMHVGEIDGVAPTGLPITQLTSCVYRVDAGRIVEYWIQIDRLGVRAQLER